MGVAKETAIKSEIKIVDVNLTDDAENTVVKIEASCSGANVEASSSNDIISVQNAMKVGMNSNMNSNFNAVNKSFNAVNKKFNAVSHDMSEQIKLLSEKIDRISDTVNGLNEVITEITQNCNKANKRIDKMEIDVVSIRELAIGAHDKLKGYPETSNTFSVDFKKHVELAEANNRVELKAKLPKPQSI